MKTPMETEDTAGPSATHAKAAITLVGYGLLVAGILFLLDAFGCFIFLTYVPFYTTLTIYGVLAAHKSRAHNKALRASATVFPALIVIFLLALPGLETSARKKLYLASRSLEVGMSVEDAKVIMRPFQVFDKFESEGTLTFGSRMDAGNEDRVIVRFSPSAKVIEKIEYSID